MGGKPVYKTREISDLKDMLNQSVQLYGDSVAFKLKTCKDPVEYKEITFKEYANDVNSLGTILVSMGLQGETVNIISNNRYEWAVSYMSVVNGLGVVSPLDKSLTNDEIKLLVKRSNSKAIIFSKEYLETILEIIDEKNTNLSYYICMDEVENPEILFYGDLIKKGTELLNSGNTSYTNIPVDNEKMSIILFTSGTTAQSKAVMLSHKNICSNILDCRAYLDVRHKDVTMSFLPLHHTFECTAGFLLMIYSGATIAYCDGLRHLVKNIKEYGVSAMICVPVLFENMYKKLVHSIKESGKWETVQKAISLFNALDGLGINTFKLRRKAFKEIYANLSPNLRLFVSGAASIDKEVVKGFNELGVMFFQGYGLTETSPVVACENEKNHIYGSVGQPLPNCEIKINEPNEAGIGEILVKAPYVMLGYYQDEQATNEAIKDGWFYTGDLGSLDKNGFLFIQGRKKNVIVLKNGKNIFPEELEDLINTIEYVKECMVFGKPDKKGDLDVWAKVVYDEEAIIKQLGKFDEKKAYKLIMKEIKKINKTIPSYKYVRGVILSDKELIKTTTQKIKRHEEIKTISFEK